MTEEAVDAVFTWVDSADPAWRRRKEDAERRLDPRARSVEPASRADHRFRDNDELKYALRSLEAHAPWIQRVFLVTDGQCPAWLDTRQVRLVRHEEIFPAGAALPVFSSTPIEMCLHRIPGLAERFISFNDDFFLGRDLDPGQFFTADGRPIIWTNLLSGRQKRRLLSAPLESISFHQVRDARARRLVREATGYERPVKVRHVPRAMRRSQLEELWERFPEVVAHNLASPFRSREDILVVPSLYSYWALATGRAVERRIDGPALLADLLRGGIRNLGTTCGDHNFLRKLARIRLLRPLSYCLNDGEDAPPTHREAMRRFLDSRHPNKCRFEL